MRPLLEAVAVTAAVLVVVTTAVAVDVAVAVAAGDAAAVAAENRMSGVGAHGLQRSTSKSCVCGGCPCSKLQKAQQV